MTTPPAVEVMKPSPRMKRLFGIYYAFFAVSCLLGCMLAIAGTPKLLAVALAPLIPVLVSAPVIAYWINAYYDSARFTFTEHEIAVERGVWWKRRDIVPYNRITNVSVIQGPVSRALGLATVRVQTAGFGGMTRGGLPTAEAELFHVENAHELTDKILLIVRRLRPVAVEAAPELARPLGDVMADILAELRKIRELHELQAR